MENFAARETRLGYFAATARKNAARLGSNILRLSFCGFGFGCQVCLSTVLTAHYDISITSRLAKNI